VHYRVRASKRRRDLMLARAQRGAEMLADEAAGPGDENPHDESRIIGF
jgi:hypothetical protein